MRAYRAALFALVMGVLSACGGGSNNSESNNLGNEGDTPNTQDDQTPDNNVSLASEGCQNVVIVAEFAYAACGPEIEVASLVTGERALISLPGNDISADADANLLFTQRGPTLYMIDISDPMQGTLVDVVSTNFSTFSGVDTQNGLVVVSGGAAGSNTQVFTFDENGLSLATNGIPIVDARTGAPDVHLTSSEGGATAFYTQDLGGITNFGIQIVELNLDGEVLETPPVVELASETFSGGFANSANFPLESEFLDGQLYVTSFAATGLEMIDLNNDNAVSVIPLDADPTNVATDGVDLFVVSELGGTLEIISPDLEIVTDTVDVNLEQPLGVAASDIAIAVADAQMGLVIIDRSIEQ